MMYGAGVQPPRCDAAKCSPVRPVVCWSDVVQELVELIETVQNS